MTDEQILSLITNLPKDLPEAFERALEGITDRRYQGNIMKIVLAAVSSLTLDELRVALTITPGDPIWRPARLPHDGSQLVSLCGGNLLELDEEDNKVRFIHHSVISHLLSRATRPDTDPYHFNSQDAENFIGSVCVTYLHLAIFDSRLTVTRNIRGDELVGKVNTLTSQELGTALVSRVTQFLKSRERTRSAAALFDIGRVASEIQAIRMQDHLDPLCFKNYAVNNWFLHTRCFNKEDQLCRNSWELLWSLLYGGTVVTATPFPNLTKDPYPALRWSVAHGHEAGFLNILINPAIKIRNISRLLEVTGHLRRYHSIHGTWLGDILAQLTELYHNATPAVTQGIDLVEEVKELCALDADPTIPHHKTGTTSVQNIITSLITSDDTDMKISKVLEILLSDQPARELLQLDFVPNALRDLMRHGRERSLKQILAFRPNLGINHPGEPLIVMAVRRMNVDLAKDLLAAGASATSSSFQGCPAIQWALVRQHKDMVELLCKYGAVNVPVTDGTSLLCMAIQSNMDDDWVSLLLKFGANHNAGPFPATLALDSSRFLLQTALQKGKTLICLYLIAHGADIHPPSGPNPLDMAIKNGDDILVAAFRGIEKKILTKGKFRQPDTVHTPTALLVALQMFLKY